MASSCSLLRWAYDLRDEPGLGLEEPRLSPQPGHSLPDRLSPLGLGLPLCEAGRMTLQTVPGAWGFRGPSSSLICLTSGLLHLSKTLKSQKAAGLAFACRFRTTRPSSRFPEPLAGLPREVFPGSTFTQLGPVACWVFPSSMSSNPISWVLSRARHRAGLHAPVARPPSSPRWRAALLPTLQTSTLRPGAEGLSRAGSQSGS